MSAIIYKVLDMGTGIMDRNGENDVILVMPVFANDEMVAWTANIAHWNDVGGMVPGSMSTDAFDILTADCRMPDFLIGDLWAGVASVRVGERRALEIVNKYGKDVFLHAVDEYLDYGERASLAALKRLPKGTYSLVEEQDAGTPWKVAVEFGTTSSLS